MGASIADRADRFQKVFDIREREERALKIQVARLDKEVRECERKKMGWIRCRDETLDYLRRARSKADLAGIDQCSDYVLYVCMHIKGCAEKQQDLQVEKEELLEELRKTMQARKLVEGYLKELKRELAVEFGKAEQRAFSSHSAHKFVSGADRV